MLRAIIICPDSELDASLRAGLENFSNITVVKSVTRYPHPHEFLRIIRTVGPQVIFVGVQQVDRALEIVREVQSSAPNVEVVAISHSINPQVLLDLMQAGVREFLAVPFNVTVLAECLGRLSEALNKRPMVSDSTDLLFAFLPSKAGSGTSTIALNAAMAIAKVKASSVLLIDFDMSCGMIGFMLKLENEYSVVDADEHAMAMDDNLWRPLVSRIGNLDVLQSGRMNPSFRMEAKHLLHLLDFARRRYKSICVDLSGNMEKFSLEIMQEAKTIFLVCTPELPSLHHAREKYLFLNNLDLGDRVSVLLNRCNQRDLVSPAQVEQLLGLPVTLSLPNDYRGVHKAIDAGKQIEPQSELGRRFRDLAATMIDGSGPTPAAPPAPQGKRRLFNMFQSRPASRGVPSSGPASGGHE